MVSWARAFAVAVAAVLLTGAFTVWSFPYERVADSLSERATAWSGIEFEFDDIGPTLSWGGIGLEARNVRATSPQDDGFLLPSVFLRPAWSLEWLRGDPQLALQIDGGELGQLDGVAGLGHGGSWDARLEDLRVAVVPLDQWIPGLSMEGQLSGRFVVELDEAGRPRGELEVEFSSGSLTAPGLPLPLPYERLNGDIALGGEAFAVVRTLTIAGPMLNASLSGTIGYAEQQGAEPLELDMQIERAGRSLRPFLRRLGITLSRKGPTRLQITGTISRPTFR